MPLTSRTILQVIPTLDTGGAERTTIDVAAAIVAAGGRALVASTGGRMEEELAGVGAKLVRLPLAAKNPAVLAANAVRLRRLIRAEHVDLVHARSRAPAWSAFAAARAGSVPFVTTYHGIYNQSNVFKSFYNSVMARGDAVIANSAWTARLIAERHPAAAARILPIPRGTDLQRFSPDAVSPERLARLRAAWGLSLDDRVVLHLARLTGWKGQAVTIEAAGALAHRGVEVVTILAGDAQGRAAYVEELGRRIASAGLDGKVRIVGHCDDAPAALALAAAAVVPSTEPEAFGRAAVEAEAMGVPVVVSDIGATAETVLAPPEVPAAARTGWRVPAGDVAATADALAEALSLSREDRAALGERQQAHVAAHFSVERMTAATLATYVTLLDRSPRPR